MEITYTGGTSFLIKGERTVAIDAAEKPDLGTIVLRSSRKRNAKLLVNGPGEYEIGGGLIASIALGDRLVHAVGGDGINIVHLVGDERRLDDRGLEAIGKVDVLLLEADAPRRAQTAISDLVPRVVIPYGPHAAEVCAAAGVKNAEPQSRFTWNGTTAPVKALLLKAPASKRRAA